MVVILFSRIFLNVLWFWLSGRYFSEDIFKRIFLKKKSSQGIPQISMKFVPMGLIDDNSDSAQV